MKILPLTTRLGITLLTYIVSVSAFSQSTPSEFADLSLQELFQIDVDEKSDALTQNSRWIVNYQYRAIEFDGYRKGSRNLSREEVLWNGPGETRTDENFPVLPTVITQDVHLLSLGYYFTEDVSFSVSAPYISQATDHISIVPGYDEFLIETSGIGDVVLSTRYHIVQSEKHNWWFSLGVSLPTGSIDEQGDTPRAPGNQQLPYTMQLGSGTFDVPLEFSYQRKGDLDISLALSAMIRTGTNDRNYRLGNVYKLVGKYGFLLSESVSAFIGTELVYSEKIKGRDTDLLVDAPIPYPAGITNPNLYGGKKVVLDAGISWKFSQSTQVTLEVGRPVYQYLNGPQPGETWRSSIQLVNRF